MYRQGRQRRRTPRNAKKNVDLTIFADRVQSLGESYAELLWLREQVAAAHARRRKTKTPARRRQSNGKGSPARPRR